MCALEYVANVWGNSLNENWLNAVRNGNPPLQCSAIVLVSKAT